MKHWRLALVLLVAACGSTTATVAVRSSPTSPTSPSSAASAPASPTLSAGRSPSPTPIGPVLTCSSTPPADHTLAVLHVYAPTAKVEVLDLADPLRPIGLCALTNVDVAQLISPTTLAIAFGTQLGVADLAARSISVTAA